MFWLVPGGVGIQLNWQRSSFVGLIMFLLMTKKIFGCVAVVAKYRLVEAKETRE